MLTITAQTLLASRLPMARLAEQQPTSLKLAYQLSKTWKAFQKESEAINEQHMRLLQKFGTSETVTDGRGQSVEVWQVRAERLDETTRADWERESAEFNAIPVELWGEPHKIDALEAAGLRISPNDLAALDWLIVE